MAKKRQPANKTNPRGLKARVREVNALNLRLAGASYPEIADALNYRSPSGAYSAVIRALDRQVEEPAEKVRQLELRRLGRLLRAYWAKALEGDCPSAKLCLDILTRRARMLGLDAPVKVDITDLVREVALAAGLDPAAMLAEARQVVKTAMAEA